MKTRLRVLIIVGGVCFAAANSQTLGEPIDGSLAKTMLQSIGSRGGLCAHWGVRNGSLAMQLSQEGKYLVHGLSSSAEQVQTARSRIAAAGSSGVVSVEQSIGNTLPYADNTVNLLVADDLAGLLKQGVEIEEVVRVLAPGGVA